MLSIASGLTESERIKHNYLFDRYFALEDDLLPPLQSEVEAILEPILAQQEDIMSCKNNIVDADKNVQAAQKNLNEVLALNKPSENKVEAAEQHYSDVRKLCSDLTVENKRLILAEINDLNSDEKTRFFHSETINLLIMQELELLDASNIPLIIRGQFVDKSCQARLNGEGLEGLNQEDKQKRWAYFCVAPESYIASGLEKPDVKLRELLFHASNKRKALALKEMQIDRMNTSLYHWAKYFGALRDEGTGDFYAKEQDEGRGSVISSAIFSSLVELINKQKESMIFTTCSSSLFKIDPNEKICRISNISSIENCILPDMRLKVTVNDLSEIERITTNFNVSTDLDSSLDALDKHFLHKFQDKEISPEELFRNLGEFVFHITRLYPFKRGGGAIIECLARGILKYHYPHLELGNIKLGDKFDIPYDVCAQLLQDPKLYSDIFADAIAKEIDNVARAKPAFNRNLG